MCAACARKLANYSDGGTGDEYQAMYQIPGYKSYYQNTQINKQSGTGVALCTHESINVSVIEEISECSPDIECLFVKSTNMDSPIFFGVVYRPNDGNKDIFYESL